jgi:hypothetical protein
MDLRLPGRAQSLPWRATVAAVQSSETGPTGGSAVTERHARLHQFLSVVGVKALRTHLGQLLGIAQISEDREEYEKHVKKIFGDQLELDV